MIRLSWKDATEKFKNMAVEPGSPLGKKKSVKHYLKKNPDIIVSVCTHENKVKWDCGCSYGCDMCNIHYHCPDCDTHNTNCPAAYTSK